MGKNKPLISIIMPVYNVGRYVEEALGSLAAQSFKDWECIVVDDGSTDNSAEVIKEFIEKDSRFELVSKKNGGVSSARNAGLERIRGTFVAFMDPDDRVEADFLHTLYDLMIKYDADVVQTGFIKDFRGFHRKKKLTEETRVLERKEILNELLKNSLLPSFLWNKLYKREVITEGFAEGKVYEDFLAFNKWMKNLRKVVVSPELTYHYRMRRGSITSILDVKNLSNLLEAYQDRLNQMDNLEEGIPTASDRNRYLYKNFVDVAKKVARNEKDFSKAKASINKIREAMESFPSARKEDLGSKLYNRVQLLQSDPDLFINKMRKAVIFDLHSRFCKSRMYR